MPKTRLKGRRNRYEDEVLLRLHEVLPPGVQVTVLADRGFGDQQLYAVLRDFDFDVIVRFRGGVTVERRDGEVRAADAWVPPNGRIRHPRGARVTRDRYALDAVVCVQTRGMQAPWCLAIGGATITGAQAVRLYGRRFTIEDTFRDVKDPRYGLGMSATHVLCRQGCHDYAALATMPPERSNPLLHRFGEYVLREPVYVHAFGLTG